MHYYQFNIGDYRKDTTHLSMLEHGAYRQLLDWLYLDEKPIPKETQVVFRRLSAKTDDEKQAIKNVLAELFTLTYDGYTQSRCMTEIKYYHGKADRARANGKLGGRPKETKVVISGLAKKTQSKANHKPITNNQELNKEPLCAKRAHQIPDDFILNENSLEYSAKRGLNGSEFDSFKNWHVAKGSVYKDWQAAWRTWCDKAVSFGRGKNIQSENDQARETARAMLFGGNENATI